MTVEFRDELKWEKEMIAFGIQRFRNQENKARDRGDFTGTNGGGRLLKGYLSQVSEFIAHYLAGNSPGGRRRSKYSKLLEVVDPDKLALISLSAIISAVYGEADMAKVSMSIGARVEDELRFTEFELEKPSLFNQLQRDLDSKNSENYRHRHRVLAHSMNAAELEWKDWGNITRAGVGALLISLTMDATDLVTKDTIREGKKSRVVLRATDEVMEWIERSDEAVAAMMPDRMPLLIIPEDWTDLQVGGYHLPRLRSSTAFVKLRRGAAGKTQREMLTDAQIYHVKRAVNAMQQTPWRINSRVLDALQRIWEANLGVGMPPSQPYEVPPSPIPRGQEKLSDTEKELLDNWKHEARELYAKEKHRKSLVLGVARTMRIGQMLRDKKEFYYVYQLDFRGRVYAATSGVSPQGADPAKGTLEFAEAKELGERGLYWLKVHGANKFGVDKIDYDARVAWIDERSADWCAVAEDPVGNRHLWKDADKPYQFLAFCFEYHGAMEEGPSFRSRLPIALDGSCNGLQHFSAMLRDAKGGAAVNLTAGDIPADIYQDVADVATEKLRRVARGRGDEATAAGNWLRLLTSLGHDGLNRKVSKKPVMTLPYGSTQQACTASIFSWYIDQNVKFFPDNTAFKHCIFLSRIMWDSIGEVVVAARAAMDWIQSIAGTLAKLDLPFQYTTPLGFPVHQASQNQDVKRVCHRIGGSRMRLTIAYDTDGLSSRKQRQGSAPNLVHSVDATHMMLCIVAGVDAGFTSFAMIHDDFGTHACHIDRWQEIIREQFVWLHTEHDVLRELKEQLESKFDVELPEPPEKGKLELTAVLKSPFFFG